MNSNPLRGATKFLAAAVAGAVGLHLYQWRRTPTADIDGHFAEPEKLWPNTLRMDIGQSVACLLTNVGYAAQLKILSNAITPGMDRVAGMVDKAAKWSERAHHNRLPALADDPPKGMLAEAKPKSVLTVSLSSECGEVLPAAMLSATSMASPARNPWRLLPERVCLASTARATAATARQDIPIREEGTMYQRGVAEAIHMLRSRRWVHVSLDALRAIEPHRTDAGGDDAGAADRVGHLGDQYAPPTTPAPPVSHVATLGRIIAELGEEVVVVPVKEAGVEELISGGLAGSLERAKELRREEVTVVCGDDVSGVERLLEQYRQGASKRAQARAARRARNGEPQTLEELKERRSSGEMSEKEVLAYPAGAQVVLKPLFGPKLVKYEEVLGSGDPISGYPHDNWEWADKGLKIMPLRRLPDGRLLTCYTEPKQEVEAPDRYVLTAQELAEEQKELMQLYTSLGMLVLDELRAVVSPPEEAAADAEQDA